MRGKRKMGLMSVAFELSKERVVVTARGDLTAGDVVDALEQLYRDPRFRPGMSMLWDVRGARLNVTGEDVRRIVAFVSKSREARGEGKSVVLTGREVDYGMARVAQVHMEAIGIELMVFREMEHAERCLDGEGESEVRAPSVEANQEPEFGGE